MNLRFIVAVLLIIVAVVVSIGGSTYVRYAEIQLLEAAEQIKNAKTIYADVNTLEELWKENKNTLSLFLNRNEIEQLDNLIACVEAKQKSSDVEDILQAAAELSAVLNDMIAEEKNSLYNLF